MQYFCMQRRPEIFTQMENDVNDLLDFDGQESKKPYLVSFVMSEMPVSI